MAKPKKVAAKKRVVKKVSRGRAVGRAGDHTTGAMIGTGGIDLNEVMRKVAAGLSESNSMDMRRWGVERSLEQRHGQGGIAHKIEDILKDAAAIVAYVEKGSQPGDAEPKVDSTEDQNPPPEPGTVGLATVQ